MSKDIYVTRPDLPDLAQLLPMLESIWESRVLTNRGPFHEQFELALRDYLEAPALSLVCNGTAALEAALAAAQLQGEVITTPYSFVATVSSLVRSGLKPVFVDIRPDDLNIDPALIEAAITPQTSAIMGVHVYGNPCAIDAIQAIADRHGLTVIYDGAHCFGARWRGRQLASFGDFTTLSFHGTKVFNTFEGGAVICASEAGKRAVDLYRNFGIESELVISMVGTNAKLNEFASAVGLLQLERVEQVRQQRAAVDARYREGLHGMNGVAALAVPPQVEPNYSYFPIVVDPQSGTTRDAIYDALKAEQVFARKYFYPLLADLAMFQPYLSGDLPVARRMSGQILCLPIYPGLDPADQDRILRIIGNLAA
ncbi:MAG: DegT/DnrJ/EryC1/StrS family aminotransferase [Erythrobacter sp.]|nr:DegT/DnrJ/EryC1/StrS family aminotransferase [Erythrobacter sp.]